MHKTKITQAIIATHAVMKLDFWRISLLIYNIFLMSSEEIIRVVTFLIGLSYIANKLWVIGA